VNKEREENVNRNSSDLPRQRQRERKLILESPKLPQLVFCFPFDHFSLCRQHFVRTYTPIYTPIYFSPTSPPPPPTHPLTIHTMIPLPRRGIRIIGIWITIPVLALTYLISLLTSSNSSSTIASDSPAARAVKNRIGLTAEREQGIIDKWEGVKRYAQDSAGSGLNMIGLGGEEGGEDDDWFLERERLEKEKTDARRNSKSRKPSSNTLDSQSRSTFPNHTYNPNGLLFLNPEGRHPIYDLIARGKKEWEEKHAKQSTTLDEAVKEYRNRYHRNPPRGFDKW
jgi:hypothetical protein